MGQQFEAFVEGLGVPAEEGQVPDALHRRALARQSSFNGSAVDHDVAKRRGVSTPKTCSIFHRDVPPIGLLRSQLSGGTDQLQAAVISIIS